jgi:Rieske Fe-S protein
MNERRRFLQMVGTGLVAAGCGSKVNTGSGGAGGNGAGGAGGMTSTSTGPMCGGGGAFSSGQNNDFCGSIAGTFDVGKPADYAGMGMFKVQNQSASVLLVRDAGGLYALSSLCTHECCDMNSVVQGQQVGTIVNVGGAPTIRCNCHFSVFKADGSVQKGPANNPLPAYQLSLGCDGVLYVDTTVVVPNTQRLMA